DAAAGDTDALSRFAEFAWDYIRLLREHIAKEDDRLFPMAERMLDKTAQERLVERFEEAEHHDRHPDQHARYLELAYELAARLGLDEESPCEVHPGCGHYGV